MPIAVPFFTGSRQLSIELAEPVVLLRGLPSHPTTHVLRGEVELLLSRPMTASQVLIQLVGKSNMLWPESLGQRGTKLCNEKTILDQNIILDSRPEDNQILPAGLNRWSFEFLIPNRIVETIEDEMAQVYYFVAATVQRPGLGTPNLRCRRNILLLRTLSPSDDCLASHSLPTTSIVSERKTEACDATIYIEKSTVSSGTQFPISIVLSTQLKNIQLEAISITLAEKRVYHVPEYNVRRAELHSYKLQLASVTDMADVEQMQQAMIPSSDIPLHQIRRALSAKNAQIPLGTTPFQYRFIFTLPNCLQLNHTSYFNEMNFSHNLAIDIELSVPATQALSPSSNEMCNNDIVKTLERSHIHLETPITILDCRLKEDYTTLPTYQESMSDTTIDEEDTDDVLKKRAGFFICPCYADYKKKSSKYVGKDRLMMRQNNSFESLSSRSSSTDSLLLPPPPPYVYKN